MAAQVSLDNMDVAPADLLFHLRSSALNVANYTNHSVRRIGGRLSKELELPQVSNASAK